MGNPGKLGTQDKKVRFQYIYSINLYENFILNKCPCRSIVFAINKITTRILTEELLKVALNTHNHKYLL
jgi:hypothetical protein